MNFVTRIFVVGSLPRLKSGILTIAFLDCNGSLIRYSYEQWKDESKEKSKYHGWAIGVEKMKIEFFALSSRSE